ncbi:hypothetical protein RhiLY_05487 [Ceratobasidium sp. AG-Ba]|nr:hypothetical protein RhiLY_05487 [Ceratobasidium sp. AG-Ba]
MVNSEESVANAESPRSPLYNSRALFTTNSQLEILDLSQDRELDYADVLPVDTSSEHTIRFREMGEYLAHFRDEEEQNIQSNQNEDLDNMNQVRIIESSLVVENVSNARSPPDESLQLPTNTIQLEVQLPEDILNQMFGEDIQLYNSLQGLDTHSGQRLILGSRLFDKIIHQFRLSPQGSVSANGVQLSQADVAAWMGQSLGTINNWRTIERRRAAFVFKVDSMSQPSPRQANMRSQLVAFETGNADRSVSKRASLERYMVTCEQCLVR